jgi:hypothetical protein
MMKDCYLSNKIEVEYSHQYENFMKMIFEI